MSTVRSILWCVSALAAVGSPLGAQPDQPSGLPQGSSLLGRELYSLPREPGTDIANPELDSVRRLLTRQLEEPDNAELAIELARAFGERWQYREAIEVLSAAIAKHPGHVLLYRYRGHRYLSLRRFDEGLADLERAVALLREQSPATPALSEADRFDIWYHLGLARYLRAEFAAAAEAYRGCQRHAADDEAKVAVSHWLYMSLRRAGRDTEAAAVLEPISDAMKVEENRNYHQLLLMYKGERAAEDLLRTAEDDPLQLATTGYGVGNWYLYRGERERALALFERITSGTFWPAFGFLAAETELARARG